MKTPNSGVDLSNFDQNRKNKSYSIIEAPWDKSVERDSKLR